MEISGSCLWFIVLSVLSINPVREGFSTFLELSTRPYAGGERVGEAPEDITKGRGNKEGRVRGDKQVGWRMLWILDIGLNSLLIKKQSWNMQEVAFGGNGIPFHPSWITKRKGETQPMDRPE